MPAMINDCTFGDEVYQKTVKLYFHIYRNTDGSGVLSQSDITTVVENLNASFEPYFFSFFYGNCEIQYHDDTEFIAEVVSYTTNLFF